MIYRRLFWFMVLGAIIFSMAGYSVMGFVLFKGNKAQCQASNEARQSIVGVFKIMENTVAEGQTTRIPPPTKEEKERTRAFFDEVYASLAPRNC